MVVEDDGLPNVQLSGFDVDVFLNRKQWGEVPELVVVGGRHAGHGVEGGGVGWVQGWVRCVWCGARVPPVALSFWIGVNCDG